MEYQLEPDVTVNNEPIRLARKGIAIDMMSLPMFFFFIMSYMMIHLYLNAVISPVCRSIRKSEINEKKLSNKFLCEHDLD